MAVKNVAIRLQPQGGAEVVSEFKRTESAGVGAAKSIQTATEAAVAAADRQVQKLREVGAAAVAASRPSPMQAQIDRVTGVTGGGNARADVAARSLFAQDDDSARRAAQLRAEIDPLGAATDRYNAELAEMDLLQRRGHLSAVELARSQDLAKTRFDATTAAINRNTGGLSRNQVASRLNLSRQAADVAVTASMGMNPAMIAMQQGPQILDALATSGIKARGALLLVGGALALTAATATTAFLAWQNGESQALALERAVTGLGRTSGLSAVELEVLAIAAAEQGEVSVRSAREQAAAYVQTGKIGGEVIGGLIAIGKDYAAVMGLDAEAATQSLAKAMAEPDKAARELTRQIGLLDQTTLDHIDSLVKHGDRLAAQKILLDALTESVDGQADRIGGIQSAWDAAARAVSNYWDQLGKALYTTPEERVEKLDGIISNARRTGGQPQIIARMERERTELQFQIGYDRALGANQAREAPANQGAQEDRDRRDRAPRAPRTRRDGSGDRAAREAMMRERAEQDRAAQIELEVSRSLGDIDHVRALEDEAAVRTRIRQLVDADVDQATALTRATEEHNRLLAARGEATQTALVAHGSQLEIEDARLRGDLATVDVLEEQERHRKSIAAYQDMGLDLSMATLLAETESWTVAQRKADLMDRIVAGAEAEHRLTLARLAGREGEVRLLERADRIASRAREIEARSIDTSRPMNRGEGEGQARREIGEEVAAEAEGVRREWLRGFIDDIRSGGIREALGNQFERATERLIDKLIEGLMAVDWSALIKGGKQAGAGDWLQTALSWFNKPGTNANGTDYWSGGLSWVGERGPELVDLPRGARVLDHQRSMALAATAGGDGRAAGSASFTFAPVIHAEGAGPREVDALARKMDEMRDELRREVPALMRDALSRRKI